jgi:alkanesulfonate monooxygenase SsuD/methylene tetrahydromethanopterin reductase-like flavin-dependent oxidoreductase (luciferase family)
MLLTLRYDMRTPPFGASAQALYEAAVEQSAWADTHGFHTVHLAEHHGAEDGYCPSPMILGSAIASRSKHLIVHFSALVAVLHHPVRLAEDLAVLDVISGGRVAVTLGIGYRDNEYDIFGVEKRRRVPILEEIVAVLNQAWTGEPFEFHGATALVRPTPVQKPGPRLFVGGSTEASARRAARYGDGYIPADRDLYGVFAAECERLGRPVPAQNPPRGPLFVHVTEEPERDWPIIAPHVLYTTNANAQWAKERGVGRTPYPLVSDVEQLRASPQFAVVTPQECIELAVKLGADSEFTFQPIMGGLDPRIAWSSLELLGNRVLPDLRKRGLVDEQPRQTPGTRR